MSDNKTETILNVLSELVRKGAAPFVRMRSNRFKIHSFPKKGGGFAYFEYDRRKGKATKIISEKEAIFREGEDVHIFINSRCFLSRIVKIIPSGQAPITYKHEFPEQSDQRLFKFARYFTDNTYLVTDNKGRLYWYSIKNLRKVGDYDSISQANIRYTPSTNSK